MHENDNKHNIKEMKCKRKGKVQEKIKCMKIIINQNGMQKKI